MSALNATNPTLKDMAAVLDPNGQIAAVVEVLNSTNEILTDMSWVEGNLATGHVTTVRSGIPMPTWRKLYGGVQPNKSTVTKITDSCGMLEAYAEVDKALADLNGNTSAFRLQENLPHIEGMNQTLATTLFYGNEGTTPEAFTGLSPRYNSSTAANTENLILGGGAGTDNASIWLVYWHPNVVHGIIPKGSAAGLQVNDKGQVTIEDASGGSNTGRMEAYRTHYRWDVGLSVRDWRGVVRIANIDKSNLTFDAATGANLPDLIFQAMEVVPAVCRMGRPALYMSRNTMTFLRRQTAAAVKQSTLGVQNVGGALVYDFQGVPLRRCDALSADEALVS